MIVPFLKQSAERLGQEGCPELTNLMYFAWLSSETLQQDYTLRTNESQEKFVAYFNKMLVYELGLVSPLRRSAFLNLLVGLERFGQRMTRHFPSGSRQSLRRMMTRLYQVGLRVRLPSRAQSNVPTAGSAAPCSVKTRPGVNLVGYVYGELGMGEQVRMNAEALEQANVAFGLVNFNRGMLSRQKASADPSKLLTGGTYGASIFHINPDQLLRAYSYLGEPFFTGRYNIGSWLWELEKPPEAWCFLLGMMDELWASSRFIENAFREKSTRPVVYMPPAVSLPPLPNYKRRDFGLREGPCLFFVMFDCLSMIERKNPLATIRAFQQAFPQGTEPVGLVLKVMHASPKNAIWRCVRDMVARDKRIVVFQKTMDRQRVLGLMNVCDCLVSLHRSEGFGRGPAEAMLLGKPVIVTNYSGSTDFTRPDNACLVDYKLVPVEKGQYPFYVGQVWADPCVEQAAFYMRKVANDADTARSMGLRGKRFVQQNFSPRTVGALQKQRLKEVGVL